MRISWQTVPGATHYSLFRCPNSLPIYCSTSIVTQSRTSYVDYGVTAGQTYYYRVKACGYDTCSVYSDYDTGYAEDSTPSVPGSVTASDGTYAGWVRIQWDGTPDTYQYIVFRCTTTALSSCYTHGYYTSYTWYQIMMRIQHSVLLSVKACNRVYCSDYSAYDTGYRVTRPQAPALIYASDGAYAIRVQIDWDLVDWATGYEVYR